MSQLSSAAIVSIRRNCHRLDVESFPSCCNALSGRRLLVRQSEGDAVQTTVACPLLTAAVEGAKPGVGS